VRETQQDEWLGGSRDPLSWWDFYDVPVPTLQASARQGKRDRVVSLSDTSAVLFYFGTMADDPEVPNDNGVSYGTDWNANGVQDGEEYDRTPSLASTQPWRSGPPDGAISLLDAVANLHQFGHDCSELD
jgi:hypothetical protein